jgi:hypothetical protein
MANLPKKFLTDREITELINGDNSELDSDGVDTDSDLDDDHASIEYTWNLACYPPPFGFNEKKLLILSNLHIK